MAGAELDYPFEASDESSENELLDQSLSVWKGFTSYDAGEDFVPVPLDLHTASSIGQCDCVRAIIHKGEEDLNKKNCGGWTALMYACYIGHDAIVRMLLEAGVAVNEYNDRRLTPLMLAASCGNDNVSYLLLQKGADLEARDQRGWTALFHATFSGHQNMVRFLIENGANMNAVEPEREFTPFMEAACAGHEIIVQYFLLNGVNVNARWNGGGTARSLALEKGHTKIVSLIDQHFLRPSLSYSSTDSSGSSRRDSSSSDDSPPLGSSKNVSSKRSKGKTKGLSIRDGPEAFDYLIGARQAAKIQPTANPATTANLDEDRDAFSETGAVTIRSSPGSSGGILAVAAQDAARGGVATADSNSVCTVPSKFQDPTCIVTAQRPIGPQTARVEPSVGHAIGSLVQPKLTGAALVEQRSVIGRRPSDVARLLEELDLSKYLPVFEEQDIDLQVFLTLTDADLQQIGIKLFGPRRKMTNAIARWHSNARLSGNGLEQAYADKLETEMQEMAIRLHQACEQLERVKLQLLQEHELRTVTEACLMEDRETWAQVINLSTDSLCKCTNMRELLNTVSICSEELGRRCIGSATVSSPNLTGSGNVSSIAAALMEGLSLSSSGGAGNQRDMLLGAWMQNDSTDDACKLTSTQLVTRLLRARDELVHLLTLVFINTETLLKRHYNTTMPGHR